MSYFYMVFHLATFLNFSITFSFCDVLFSIWYKTVLLWIKKAMCQNKADVKAFSLRVSLTSTWFCLSAQSLVVDCFKCQSSFKYH